MQNQQDFFSTNLMGNPLSSYALSLMVCLGCLLGLKLLEKFLIRQIQKKIPMAAQKTAAFIIAHLEKTVIPTLYFAAFYFSFTPLVHDPRASHLFYGLWLIVLSIQSTKIMLAVLIYLYEEFWLRKQSKPENAFASKTILNLSRFGIWSVCLIFVLDNLGFNVSAVVAGLGIGGVAVALAAQTILGDLFNYFVIFFDRPFEEGDFVVFDDYMGTIENIGVKSTRIRSLNGEQIVISNSNLTNSKIRNFKRMAERRVIFGFGIIYETPLEKIKRVSGIIRGIIAGIKDVRLDRVHFKNFGDYSLNFEIVYYVLNADYNRYMDIQESINLTILEKFEAEGIEFAYPTAVAFQKALK